MTTGIGPSLTDSPFLGPEPEFHDSEDFFDALLRRERLTASILNIKENAQYEKRELLTGQQFFSQLRQQAIVTNYTFRVVFDLVELHGGNIGAGLTSLTLTATTMPPLLVFLNGLMPVHMFGAATVAGPKYLPLPYASATGANIEIWFDNTNPAAQTININNAYGAALTTCIITFEYWKF